MKSERIARGCLLIAGIMTAAMALYHFRLPYIWNWEKFVTNIPSPIRWGVFSINFFLSFLLLGGGVLTILASLKKTKKDLVSYGVLFSMGLFWIVNFLYQIVIPMPAPPKIRSILLVFAALLVTLYIFPTLLFLRNRKN